MREIRAYADADHTFVVWQEHAPIPGCRGFALKRRPADSDRETTLDSWVGFAGDTAPAGTKRPSSEWPIQRFMWSDYAPPREPVCYRAVPLVGDRRPAQRGSRQRHRLERTGADQRRGRRRHQRLLQPRHRRHPVAVAGAAAARRPGPGDPDRGNLRARRRHPPLPGRRRAVAAAAAAGGRSRRRRRDPRRPVRTERSRADRGAGGVRPARPHRAGKRCRHRRRERRRAGRPARRRRRRARPAGQLQPLRPQQVPGAVRRRRRAGGVDGQHQLDGDRALHAVEQRHPDREPGGGRLVPR